MRRCPMRYVTMQRYDQELLGAPFRGVEVGCRKGQGNDNEFRGAQLPKKAKCRSERKVDSEECHNAAEADLPMTAPWYRRGGTSV
ncbi:hypothetical protein BHE74_00023329 [Ensete ventricosum]|nr:hypothetical protein GW17_00047883 [Ensete ventricosum]RWW69091.1 hypothetical protein BHE74_00023329 [Ensete ventricosum]RZR78758.1 hypothetical protein BHM03_00004250 [Ensete ventricosum]